MKPDIHTLKSLMDKAKPKNLKELVQILYDNNWTIEEYQSELPKTANPMPPKPPKPPKPKLYENFGINTRGKYD